MEIILTSRRGFALLIVILLMAVGSALMIGAMNGSLVDGETARMATMRRQVLVGAESEAWTTLANVDVAALRRLPLGPVSVSSHVAGDMALIASVEKVDTSIVWIVATASIHRGILLARHRIGMSALIPHDTAEITLHPVPEHGWVELF